MIVSSLPDTVTLVAGPPPEARGSPRNAFIDDTLRTLAARKALGNRVLQVASVRDADLALTKIFAKEPRGQVRLQIIGHSLSGMLSLGASWFTDDDVAVRAFRYPYYVLDTNPAALGLLAKHAGRISEVMLVGCHVGAASSFGYAINGRTLTYTLAELLRCVVRGADDVVAPDEFDARGYYQPSQHHRRAKGWRWNPASPPVWTDPHLDPAKRAASGEGREEFELHAITRSVYPGVSAGQTLSLDPPLRVSCTLPAVEDPRSALAELAVLTDRGPAELLCGGQLLRWEGACYPVIRDARLSEALTTVRWSDQGAPPEDAGTPRDEADVGGEHEHEPATAVDAETPHVLTTLG